MSEKILILDFGSQYTQLIARRIRELNVYCEILPYNAALRLDDSTKAVILSGSPFSVTDKNALKLDLHQIIGKKPVLGICYGAQLIADFYGGKVQSSSKREYGKAKLVMDREGVLFKGLGKKGHTFVVWMSHGDQVRTLPEGFHAIAHSRNTPIAAMEHPQRRLYATQFHPEVAHTEFGQKHRLGDIRDAACARELGRVLKPGEGRRHDGQNPHRGSVGAAGRRARMGPNSSSELCRPVRLPRGLLHKEVRTE